MNAIYFSICRHFLLHFGCDNERIKLYFDYSKSQLDFLRQTMRIVQRADFSIQITLSVCALENKLSGFFHFWMTYNLSIFLNWKFCPNLLLYALQTPWITTLLDFEKYYSYIFHFFTSSNIAFEVTTFFSQTPISVAASLFSNRMNIWDSLCICISQAKWNLSHFLWG